MAVFSPLLSPATRSRHVSPASPPADRPLPFGGPLPSSVTNVAAATGSVRQPSSSVRSSARPAQRQWQGNPARKGYDDFRNKHHLRPEGQHRLPRPRIQRDGSWRPGRRD